MKKLLIIGASVLQLPAIKKAKELGYYVGVVDYDPNAVGIQFADEYFNVSTIDIDGVVDVARRFQPNGITTLATDMPIRSIAAAAKALSLPAISIETAIKATDKGEMIKAFEEHGIAHPKYFIINNEDTLNKVKDMLPFPCIIKPCDNSGSRGVVLCKEKSMLKQDYLYAKECSRGGCVIIEEFLQGTEVSIEIMVLNGTPHVLQVTDKLTTGAPHFVEMGHSQPSRLDRNSLCEIKNLAINAVKALEIKSGPAHVEIMLTENGPKMIELGARLGGDCITTHLVPLSTGIDMLRAVIELSCGVTPDITPKFSRAGAMRFIPLENAVIKKISGIEEALKTEGVTEISLIKKAGDAIGNIKSTADRVGFVVAGAKTPEDAQKNCVKALEKIKIETI